MNYPGTSVGSDLPANGTDEREAHKYNSVEVLKNRNNCKKKAHHNDGYRRCR
jgi:hypothetical protein